MSKQAMSAKFLQFTSYPCKKFSCSKIVEPSLLPRREWDTRELEDINFNIARKILDLSNAHFVPHHNLFMNNTEEILNDKKHLNEQGLKIFLKNLKDCLLGRNFSKAAFIQHKFHGPRQARNNPGEHKPQNFAAPIQGAWGRRSITTNYNSNNSGSGRTQSLYHNAGASASHRKPDDITNPEDVLVASKRDTPYVSGNIKDMLFDNFLQMLYQKLVQ